MYRTLSFLAFLSLSACASLTPVSASPCAELGLECTAKDNILIVGTGEDASKLLELASAASEKFESTFDRPAANIVIVPGGVISAGQNKAFQAAGYPASLPWVSAADKAKLRESSIRKQVMEQTAALPETIREQALQQALSAAGGNKESDDLQAGAFAHELGHLWFIQAFKPEDAEDQKGHAYGGWAPDWLDETAAVLLENEALNKRRREKFRSLKNEEIIPLREFLTMEHPSAKAAQNLRNRLPSSALPGVSSESRAIILTGKEAEAFMKASGGNRTADFYAQAKAFSDFMISRTNDIAVYQDLTEFLLMNGDFESWLASEGANWNLPTSVDTLETVWADWIASQ